MAMTVKDGFLLDIKEEWHKIPILLDLFATTYCTHFRLGPEAQRKKMHCPSLTFTNGLKLGDQRGEFSIYI